MRWKLSFPEIVQPFTGRKVLVLSAHPIPVPGGGDSPTHCECVVFTHEGKTAQLVTTLHELTRAPRVHMLECREIRAANALIYDARGRVLRAGEA